MVKNGQMSKTNKVDVFHTAVRENKQDEVRRLVKSGVSVNSAYYGMTPLHVAITKGHIDLAVWLIDNGADVQKSEINGTTTPFEEAVTRDQVQVVKSLGKSGIVNFDQILSSGDTALTHAAKNKQIYLTQILIEGGADVNIKNKNEESALWLSACEGHTGIAERLIKGGAQLDVQCGDEKLTPLLCSVTYEHLPFTKLLVKAKCDLNIKDSSGWTALWHAVSNSNEDLARILIQSGADVSITDEHSRTLVEEATENEDDEILHMLKSKLR